MQKLIYTNPNGGSIELKSSAPFVISRVEGTGKVETNFITSKGYKQDGNTLHDILLENRAIVIEGAAIGISREDMYSKRMLLSRVLNPKLGPGKLKYVNDYTEKVIEAVVEDHIYFTKRYGNNQQFTFTFLCHKPLWEDESTLGEQLSYIMGGFQFPLTLPTQFATRGYQKVIDNKGDVPTPVTITFYGPAVNPTVKNNTTGEYVKVKRNLLDTDKLIITTEYGNKTVSLVDGSGNQSNAFHYIDPTSTFWSLKPGENLIEYASDTDKEKAKVIIEYCNRYVGV